MKEGLAYRGRNYGNAIDTVHDLDARVKAGLVTRLETAKYWEARNLISLHDGLTPRQFRARLKQEARLVGRANYQAGLDYNPFGAISWMQLFAALALVGIVALCAAIIVIVFLALMGVIPR